MQPFVINHHGRLVFPSNFMPELDFSVIESEAQLDSVIRRDFEQKAPKGTEIQQRLTELTLEAVGTYSAPYHGGVSNDNSNEHIMAQGREFVQTIVRAMPVVVQVHMPHSV